MARSRTKRLTWIFVGLVVTVVVILAWQSASAPLSKSASVQSQLTYLSQVRGPLAQTEQLSQAVSTVREQASTMMRPQLATTLASLDEQADDVALQVRSIPIIGRTAIRTSALVAAANDWAAAARLFEVGVLASIGEGFTPPASTSGAVVPDKQAASLQQQVQGVVDSGNAGPTLEQAGLLMESGDAAYVQFVASIPTSFIRKVSLPAIRWVTDNSLWNAQKLAVFGSDLRTSTSLAAVHDVGLVLVSTDPQPIGGGPDPTMIASGKLNVTVVVTNAGNVEEPSMPLDCALGPAGPATADQPAAQDHRLTVDLGPGQRMTTSCGGFILMPGFAYTLTVKAGPVPGQISSQGTSYAETFTDQL